MISDQQFQRMYELLETGVSALLYKPLMADRFKQAFSNALDKRAMSPSDFLKVISGKDNFCLKEMDIIAVERVGEECRMTIRDGRLLDLNESISDLVKH
ncbi:hypothetical protein [Niabella hibiscisoli]|uniref:hypothetical protein n=1 Tax=Niabella hibiscisoli TaxID=1825928 RepID=UPI001F1147F8|nr:hypothetical protein [Niabella hibiscisoli]MCH5719101.1 hypothetical protein [Niabella hibiscisoli]